MLGRYYHRYFKAKKTGLDGRLSCSEAHIKWKLKLEFRAGQLGCTAHALCVGTYCLQQNPSLLVYEWISEQYLTFLKNTGVGSLSLGEPAQVVKYLYHCWWWHFHCSQPQASKPLLYWIIMVPNLGSYLFASTYLPDVWSQMFPCGGGLSVAQCLINLA